MIGEDDLVRHQLALQVGVGVVLATVVTVAGDRLVGREPLEPVVDVRRSGRLGVVDVDGRGDVHRIDEHEAVLDPGGARRTASTRSVMLT